VAILPLLLICSTACCDIRNTLALLLLLLQSGARYTSK
jgi:hypothetical protein